MPDLRDCKRILVIGPGGAGKSTFARRLGAATGLPVIHLDRHYWRPGWRETPAPEWNERVAQLVSGDKWIIDGNYSGTLAGRLERCDAVVFLDFSRFVCLSRVIRRRLSTGRRTRSDMAEGCDERITLEFLRWIWRYHKRSRPRTVRALEALDPRVKVIRLTSARDTRNVLASCITVPDPATCSSSR